MGALEGCKQETGATDWNANWTLWLLKLDSGSAGQKQGDQLRHCCRETRGPPWNQRSNETWQQANGSPEICSLSDGRCPRSHLLDGQPPPSPRTGLPPSLPPARPPEIVRGARKSSGPVCGSRAQGIGRHMHRGRGEDEDVLPGKCRAPVSQRSGVSRRGRSTERQKRETQDLSQRYGLTELWELPVVSASLLSSLLMLQLEVRTGSYEGKIIPRRGKSIMSWNP
uniref:Uncharacterized protein n=1 Tax=Rangifer tarandus platyrhynchus TaxID=3082113 RepID=A0ACB0FBA2_RANTA|nr:unnamed protein product [Rangifer tarandus platyrhynchus]